MTPTPRPRLIPLLVVIASATWLFSSAQVLLASANSQYWREILGSLVAVAGLNGYLSAVIDDFQRCLRTVTLRITNSGDIICLPYLSGLLGGSASTAAARRQLAQHIRDGNLDLINLHVPRLEAIKKDLKAKGVNVERGDIPALHRLSHFRQALSVFSEHCNTVRLQGDGNILSNDDIIEVCLGLVRHVFELNHGGSREARAFSRNVFSPYGVHSDDQERPRFHLQLSAESLADMEKAFEIVMPPCARVELTEYPRSVVLRDFLPALSAWTLHFRQHIKNRGGILERLDDQIWPLIYWDLELMPASDFANGTKKSVPAAGEVAAQTVQLEPEAS